MNPIELKDSIQISHLAHFFSASAARLQKFINPA